MQLAGWLAGWGDIIINPHHTYGDTTTVEGRDAFPFIYALSTYIR